MKKTISIEINQCDFCHNERHDCYAKCLGCGKDVCFDCDDKVGVTYRHSVHWQGSGDGFYCHNCETNPDVQNSLLHLAFVAIRNLKNERENSWNDFDKRARAAEQHLVDLQKFLET